jgi:hypothetical protein
MYGGDQGDPLRTVVIVDLSAHVVGGDIELIGKERGTKEEIGTKVTAVVEGVASDHADDVRPVVEETGLSVMAVMKGKRRHCNRSSCSKRCGFVFKTKRNAAHMTHFEGGVLLQDTLAETY